MLYLPVDPSRDPEGRIRVLTRLLGEDASKPYPVSAPTIDANTGLNPVVKYYQTTQEAAAQLGAGDLFKVSASGFYQAAILDVVVGVPKYRVGTIGPNDKIVGTFWGFSVRLSMRIRTLDVKIGADLGYVAAAVQSGAADVQYSVAGIGIDRKIFAAALRGIPLFGKMDYTAFAKFKGALDDLTTAMAARVTTSPLLPLGVFVMNDPFNGDIVAQARDVRWAMAKIANGFKRTEALASAPEWLRKENAGTTYDGVLGKAQDAPSEHATTTARDWLSVG
jgi:hypothetical protein